MRTRSVRALVERRHIRGDKFLFLTIQVPIAEMNGITEVHNLGKKIGPGAKALEDFRHTGSFRVFLLPSGVDLRQGTRRILIVNPPYPCHRSPSKCG